MLAAESSNYMTGVRYSNEPAISNYLDLLKRSASSTSLSAAKLSPSPRASASAFFSKPSGTLDSAESGEIYKKAASEYAWNNELPDQGESLEDQSDYGFGGQSHGGMLNSYGGGMGYQKGKAISITPDHKPITLHYRTHSQPIMVHQTRIPGRCLLIPMLQQLAQTMSQCDIVTGPQAVAP